ncbi:MAG: SDR family NAD(P)-dependent oxidoreductase, partial [Planctomycetota bacterium]
MDLGLSDKRALVLGSSRGLGFGIAKALAAEGCRVLMNGRVGDSLDLAVEAVNAQGAGQATALVADLSEPGSAASIAAAAETELGGVDILINNGGGPPPGSMAEVDPTVLSANFDRMVTRLVEITTRLLPGMRERRWGRILTITSSGVVQPIPNLGLSNTLRASLITWSKTLAAEVAADGVTVNCILPGRIHTQRVDELDAGRAERQGIPIEE